jgi:hypothetical protein
MRILKLTAAILVAVGAVYFVVMNFSAKESTFVCSGTVNATAGQSPAEVFLRITEYRWWVHLWSESDGSVSLEVPNTTVEYYGHVKVVGDQLQIYRDPSSMKGNFSKMSHYLLLSTSVGPFEGSCVAR